MGHAECTRWTWSVSCVFGVKSLVRVVLSALGVGGLKQGGVLNGVDGYKSAE